VVQVSRNLKGLLGARISAGAMEKASSLPAIAKTAEQVAVAGLTRAQQASARVDRVLSRLHPGRRAPNLQADSPADIELVWRELSADGLPYSSGYAGKMVELPDGTRVGYRATSASGGPTVDVFRTDRTHIKVHFP
jgi:hypothetical protein